MSNGLCHVDSIISHAPCGMSILRNSPVTLSNLRVKGPKNTHWWSHILTWLPLILAYDLKLSLIA